MKKSKKRAKMHKSNWLWSIQFKIITRLNTCLAESKTNDNYNSRLSLHFIFSSHSLPFRRVKPWNLYIIFYSTLISFSFVLQKCFTFTYSGLKYVISLLKFKQNHRNRLILLK